MIAVRAPTNDAKRQVDLGRRQLRARNRHVLLSRRAF
jgi:hypothetical protein